MRARTIVAAALLLGVLAAIGLVAQAGATPTCDISWASAVSGDWSDGTKWTGGVAPDTTKKVCITVAGTYTVSVKGSQAAAGVTLGNATGTQTLEIDATNANGNAVLTLSDQGNGSDGVLANGVVLLKGVDGTNYSWLDITGGSLANAGTLDVEPRASGTAVQYVYGNLSNTGTVQINGNTEQAITTAQWTTSGSFAIASGKTLTFYSGGAGGSFTQTAGTLTNNGTFTQSAGVATFSGSGTATGNPLDLVTVDVRPSGTGSGTFRMLGSASTLGSNVASGYTLVVTGTPSANAKLNVNVDRTNNGVIRLAPESAGSDYSWLNVASGTLTNAGTVDVEPRTAFGAYGTFQFIDGNLSNTGTVQINGDTHQESTTAQWSTSGPFTIASGKTLTFASGGSGGSFTQTAGTLTNNGTFTQSAGVATFSGSGTATGNPLDLVTVDVRPSGTGSGTFRMLGSASTLGSNVASGYTVVVTGTPSALARLDVNVDRTNNGVIRLAPESAGSDYSWLNVASGTLTNAGTVDVEPRTAFGAYGTFQFIDGNLSNTGTVQINGDTHQESTTAQWSTSGPFTIASGKTLTFASGGSGGSFTHSAGTLTDNGAFTQSGGTWTQTGGQTVLPNSSSGLTVTGGVVAVQGGTLKGVGTVSPALNNSGGTVQPGNSPGVMTIAGDYTQGAGGTLAIDIAGTTPGTGYDRLTVSGSASLGGTLAINSSGFTPASTNTFKIINGATTRTGTFATVTGASAGPATYVPQYEADGVTLTVSSLPPSNLNPPSIPSTGKVGQKVTCNPGTWTRSPTSFAYTWTFDTSIIASQHGHTYTLGAGDAGHKIRCQVVAHNAKGNSSASTSNALTVAKPISSCKDTIAPSSKIKKLKLKNGQLSLNGTASDKPCKSKPGKVVRVIVTISRHVKNGCRFLLEDGHSFGPFRKCDGAPPIVFPAKGTSKWSLKMPAVLPAGSYTIRSRAIDAAGNVEAVHSKGPNVLSLKVK